jgi:diketogulonate reductase-like aldo/keto reductase
VVENPLDGSGLADEGDQAHVPGGFGAATGADPDFPRRARATIWRTFYELAVKGAARAIGVSSFTSGHLLQISTTGERVSGLSP